jgi:hypothetical protein
MELKLGQAPHYEGLFYSESSNISLLPSITSINKDLTSATCPILFQDSDSELSAILSIFTRIEYKHYTTNIKEKIFLCL